MTNAEVKLNVDSRDTTLAIILDVIVSMLLRSAVSTPVYIASMFALVILSCLYVSFMAQHRHKREIESVRRLFR